MKTVKELYPAVAFGTSGVRALVADLTDQVVATYVAAFVSRLKSVGMLVSETPVVVGIDLRPSSPRIAATVCRTVQYLGYPVEYLGSLPTPALALRCLQTGTPGIMVTGSHIPFDRNGIKFYSPAGEILKGDEQAIADARIDLECFSIKDGFELPMVKPEAQENYARRYLDYFGATALLGMRIGLYQHSAVGRDLTRSILESLGATVVSLGRSDAFVPIDTEAVSEQDLLQARQWCREHGLDALVSTDGDGDRPLVFNERGDFVQGDLLGLVCARKLGLRFLAVPVSCNTAIEISGVFDRVLRTRIGSPYVIAGMNELLAAGCSGVAGFEANGGFLLGSAVAGLDALPTRDALLPMVALLVASVQAGKPVSALIEALPVRYTHSDRLKEIQSVISAAFLNKIIENENIREMFFGVAGKITDIDNTDGVRAIFKSGDIVHLRASGNAPELRCYSESESHDKARELTNLFLRRSHEFCINGNQGTQRAEAQRG